MTRRCGRWESVVTGLSSSEPLPASSLALLPQMRRASARPRRIIRAPEPIHAPRARTCGLYPRRRSRFPVDSLSRDVDGSRDPAASDPRRARAGPGQPRVIGLGDRAYKRGVRYDSSVSDLEWHRVIRIPSGWRAPDRPAGSVAHMWDRPVQRDASGGRCDVSGWRRIHHHACGETCRRGSCAAIRVAASEERCGPRPVWNGVSVMEIARRVGVTRRTAVARPRIVASGCWSRGKPTWPGGGRRVAARRWRLWRGLSGQRFACYVAPVRRSCALSRRIRAAAPVDTSARRWPTAPLLFPSSR